MDSAHSVLTITHSELDREANIAKNRALFEDLGLKQSLNSLSAAKTSAKPVQAKRVKRERPEEELVPRRQSKRLIKKSKDESPEEKKAREVW